jgi:cytochrome P450
MKELRAAVKITNKKLEIPRPNFQHLPKGISPLFNLMLTVGHNLKEAKKDNVSREYGNILPQFAQLIEKKQATLTEMIMACAFILFAGYETVSSLLSNCFVHLATHPLQFKTLKAKPEKIDSFIEEALRYYTPVTRFLRRTKKEVKIGDQVIPEGAIVILMVGAANTDPEKFDLGCRFNLDRSNAKQHLSFGKGPHFCIGANLARLQVKLALNELIKRADHIQISKNQPFRFVTDRDNGIYRYEQLKVIVH